MPFSRSGGILGVLRVAFKALVEYVREESFAAYGVQQLQVDSALLSELSRDFVENDDAAMLSGLLAEAVGSAAQRCAAPELLDEGAIAALCEERKRSVRFE